MADTGPQTHASLLLRVKSLGDQASWAEFTALYEPVVRRYLRWRGLKDQDADDLVQNLFGILLKRLPTFDYDPAKGRFRGWLKTVTENLVRRFFLRQRQVPPSPGGTVAQEQFQQLADSRSGLDDRWEEEYQKRCLELAMHKVRTRVERSTWRCFQLTALDGLSAEQAAKQLNLGVGRVYVNKCRIIKHIQEEVGRLSDD